MAGRKKEECYHYDSGGKYLGKFESLAKARETYYSEYKGKYPLFRDNINIHKLPDETLIARRKIGRDAVLRFLKFEKNPFRSSDSSKIEIFDIEFNKIAEFSNRKTCSILTGLTINQVNSYLRKRVGNLPSNELGLIFKYKLE